MDDLFLEYYDSQFNIIESHLNEGITEYYEAYDKNHHITEKTNQSLVSKIKEFFINIINAMRSFLNNIKNKTRVFINSNSLEIKLNILRKKYIQDKENGIKYVETYDISKYKTEYLKMVNSLWKYAKKFSTIKYDSIDQIDIDMKKFDKIYNDYEYELEKIENKKIRVNIDEMISFLKKEIDGTSNVYKTIDECTTKLNDMKTSASNLLLKRDVIHSDVIPEHVGFIKKMCMKITSFIRKKISKFISFFVFIFA